MIELAPNHKIGLPVDNPVLLAGGTVAYGEAIPRGVDLSRLGGVVVGPISHYSQRGSEPPRLGETVGGMVLETGLQNRGASRVMKRFAKLWPRLGCPVIAQIADNHPDDAHATARRLNRAGGQMGGLMGLELLLAPHAVADDVFDLVDAIRQASDLPIWVKLPLEPVVELAYAGAEAGADALVVGQPAPAAAMNSSGEPVFGPLYGPLAFGPMLASLLRINHLQLGLPLIACGGLHTPQQIAQAMDSGASAVQLDSVVWVEPGIVAGLLEMNLETTHE